MRRNAKIAAAVAILSVGALAPGASPARAQGFGLNVLTPGFGLGITSGSGYYGGYPAVVAPPPVVVAPAPVVVPPPVVVAPPYYGRPYYGRPPYPYRGGYGRPGYGYGYGGGYGRGPGYGYRGGPGGPYRR